MTYIPLSKKTNLISNTLYINTNNEIQLLKKYNLILITNAISLQKYEGNIRIISSNMLPKRGMYIAIELTTVVRAISGHCSQY